VRRTDDDSERANRDALTIEATEMEFRRRF
jgi:hypothetical protein